MNIEIKQVIQVKSDKGIPQFFGLGVDNLIYRYKYALASWELYKKVEKKEEEENE